MLNAWFRRTARAGFVMAAIVMACGGSAVKSPEELEIVDFLVEDLNGDGVTEIVVLKKMAASEWAAARFDEVYDEGKLAPLPPEAEKLAEGLSFANALMVFRPRDTLAGLSKEMTKWEMKELMAGDAMERLYAGDFTSLRPLMLRVGDIDGDGIKELSICVFKTTEFHPVYAKRPFIYRYNHGGLSPVWRGSRLSKPFDDYLFLDVDKDGAEELISLETVKDGGKTVSCYGWRDFGFELMARSPVYDELYGLRGEADGEIAVTIAGPGQGRAVRLQYHKNEGRDRFYDEGSLVEVNYSASKLRKY